MGEHGARAVRGRTRRALTHCNTGGLATAGYGTALGAIRDRLRRRACVEHVYVDETRPLLQGSRLTAWELERAAIPYTVIVDCAAGALMAGGEVTHVVVGADRIAANGDVANKIGTYALAVLAAHHAVPFVVVAPTLDGRPGDADGRRDPDRGARRRTRSPSASRPGTRPSTSRRPQLIDGRDRHRGGVHRPP